MERLRVAMLTEYPLGGVTGGIEAVAVTLARALARLPEVDLHVLSVRREVRCDRVEEQDGVRVHHLASPRPRLLSRALRDAWRVRRALRSLAPDVVHAHAAHLAWAALGAPAPVVWTPHAVLARQGRLWRGVGGLLRRHLYGSFERAALRRVGHIIEISPYIGQQLRPRTAARFHPIENPLDGAFFQERPLGFDGPFLFVGRVYPRKGLHVLVEAVARAHAHGAAVRVDVFDAAYERQLCRAVHEHGLGEAVRFLGHREGEELLGLYARCRGLVLPSLDEAAPMVVAEAMAVGKPVVATAVCGLPWLVRPGETGYLAPPGDPLPLAAALTTLWGDEELARRMGAAARAEARARFDAGTVARRTLEVYRAAAGPSRKGPRGEPGGLHPGSLSRGERGSLPPSSSGSGAGGEGGAECASWW